MHATSLSNVIAFVPAIPRRGCGFAVGAAASLLLATASSAAPPVFPGAMPDYKAWIAARLPGNPEGLAADAGGALYASIFETGQVVRLDGKGGYEVVATVPDPTLARQGASVGIEFSKDGSLYVAYVWHYSENEELDPLHAGCRDSRDVYTGIYKVNVGAHTVEPFVTKKNGWPVCFPDDIAFDPAGNMYVTDLTLAGIWRIAPDGRFSLWSADPLLQWPGAPFYEYPEGVNDLAISRDGKALIAVTDGAPMILRIPINADGSAGKVTVVARGLGYTDGVDIDDAGNIYVAEIERNEISLYSPDGKQRVVIATADTAPLAGPTSLVYRNGVLCTANLNYDGDRDSRNAHTVACISGFRRPTR